MHRWFGLSLALLLSISAITGVLLALKKEINLLQPTTQKGESTDLSSWMPLEELQTLAEHALRKHLGILLMDNRVDRIDVRPGKGVIKVLFEKEYWEVQMDGKTGEVLSVARRHSDWIEALHDGSIISDGFKLVSMNVLGWGVLFLIFTGIWLWGIPRLLRKWKKGNRNS